MRVSIIICTCNRSQDLSKTLEAMRALRRPEGIPVELLVVDNASTDDTPDVVRAFQLDNIPVRYICETKRGLSHARNRGVSEAAGEIILFTDDDVRPPQDWITGMCAPLWEGKAEAVAGGVRTAPYLVRPWMQAPHYDWLAETRGLDPDKPDRMVGANMGFLKSITEKIPAFDTELGAGTPRTHEETLFAWQLNAAGYRIAGRLDMVVEHHCGSSRLRRASFLSTAERLGHGMAYVDHHWWHRSHPYPAAKGVKHLLRLAAIRLRERSARREEGISLDEMFAVQTLHFYQAYLRERKLPRKYALHGLAKLTP